MGLAGGWVPVSPIRAPWAAGSVAWSTKVGQLGETLHLSQKAGSFQTQMQQDICGTLGDQK